MTNKIYPFIILFLSACIGIDTVDDRIPFIVNLTLEDDALGRTVEQPIELGLNTSQKLFRITNLKNEEINDQLIWKVEPADLLTANKGVLVPQKEGLAKLTIWENSSKRLPENHTWYIKVVQFERIKIKSASNLNAVLVGKTLQLEAQYYDVNNEMQSVAITWESKDKNIATIDENGLLTGVAIGQVEITAKVNEKEISSMLLINVSDEEDALVSLEITSSAQNLKVGQTLQLEVVAKNLKGENITPNALVWESSKTDILTVSTTGLITAVAAGKSAVSVSEGNIKSMPLEISVLASIKERLGTFIAGSGRGTSGTVTLFVDPSDNKLKVRLNSDFIGASIPGPTLYLSNDPNKITNAALEIQTITAGAGNNRVFAIPTNPDIAAYNYLIYYCKPFSIIYGTFQFN